MTTQKPDGGPAHTSLPKRHHPLRMQAYYFGFGPTGVEAIDRVLSAVAHAGKGYHHTEGWQDEIEDWDCFRGGCFASWIYNAAKDAANHHADLVEIAQESLLYAEQAGDKRRADYIRAVLASAQPTEE